MEVLTAFIHEHSYEQWSPPAPPGLAWIGRLERSGSAAGSRRHGQTFWLRSPMVGRRDAERDVGLMDLYGANLATAKLLDADLGSALLADADLRVAVLPRARLGEAVLRDATSARRPLTTRTSAALT